MKVIFTFDCEDVVSIESDRYLLDVAKALEEFEVRGVFYLTCMKARMMWQRSRRLLTSIIQAGHEVGYHSYNHSLSTTPEEEVLGFRELEGLVGKPVRMYNAPYFIRRPEITRALRNIGVRYIRPTIYLFEYGYRHKFDYLLRSGCDTVVFGAHPDGLSHDGLWEEGASEYNERRAKDNLQRLKSLLRYVKSQGVETTTLSALSPTELKDCYKLKTTFRFGLKALYHYALYRLATLQYLPSLLGRTKHGR